MNRLILKLEELNQGIKVLAAFIAIYFIWGSTYLAIRISIETIPPFMMAGVRFMFTGAVLFLWSYVRNPRFPNRSDWKKGAFSGIPMLFGGNGIVVWSQQFVPSGFAAVMVATVPLWMIMLNFLFFEKNKPDTKAIIGIMIGLGGVFLIAGIDESILLDTAAEGRSVMMGAIMLVVASASWAAGSLYSRRVKSSVSLLYFISLQMLTGGAVLSITSVFKGEFSLLAIPDITFRSIFSFIYLIVFGTLIAYIAYVWLLRVSTPAKVGTYAFFNPLVAIILGWLFVDEPITLKMLLGTGAILISVLLINRTGSTTLGKKRVKASHIRHVKDDTKIAEGDALKT